MEQWYVDDEPDVVGVWNYLHGSTSVELDGPHRAGHVPLAHAVRDDLHGTEPFPFPGNTKAKPWFGDSETERAWLTFTVILTHLDNNTKGRWRQRDGQWEAAHIWLRYLTSCSAETLEHVHTTLERSLVDVENNPELTLSSYTRRMALHSAVNPNVTPEIRTVARSMKFLRPHDFSGLLSERTDVGVWERLLFDYRVDVTGHPSCPTFLCDVFRVAG